MLNSSYLSYNQYIEFDNEDILRLFDKQDEVNC